MNTPCKVYLCQHPATVACAVCKQRMCDAHAHFDPEDIRYLCFICLHRRVKRGG
jgi:hypothetical protein